MPRKKALVHDYFTYNVDDNTSICKILVDTAREKNVPCGEKIKSKHASNLKRHVERYHKTTFKEMQDSVEQRPATAFRTTPLATFSVREPQEPQPSTSTGAVEVQHPAVQEMHEDTAPSRINTPASGGQLATTSTVTGRKRGPRQAKLDTYVERDLIKVRMTKARIEEACVAHCAIEGRPYRSIDSDSWRMLMDPYLEALPGKFTMSAEKMPPLIANKAKIIRDEITAKFKGKLLALKLDCVTRLDRGFLGVNIQCVDEAKIIIRCLGVIELERRHTGIYLAGVLTTLLTKYDLDVKQLYSMTIDNGKNMVKAGQIIDSEISDLLMVEIDERREEEEEAVDNVEEDFMNIVSESFDYITKNIPEITIGVNTMRCVAHTLQLVVINAIKEMEEDFQKVIAKIRTMIKKLRNPNLGYLLALEKLKKNILDCVTRWCSTHDMLEGSENYRDFCQQHKVAHSELDITEEDWRIVRTIIEALAPAKRATIALQAEQLTVGDMFNVWYTCYYETKQISSPLAAQLINHMDKREGAIMGSPVVLAALYLDPRFQVMLTEQQKKTAMAHLVVVSKRQSLLKAKERASNDDVSGLVESAEMQSSDDEINTTTTTFREILKKKELERSTSDQGTRLEVSVIETHLKSYDNVKCLDPEANVLDYWHSKRLDSPLLYELACVVHGAPTVQVSVERLFSGLKFILSPQRYNLGGDRVDDIMCVRTNTIFKKN